MMNRLASMLLALLLLSGCIPSYVLIEPKRQSVGDVLSVEPGMQWNKISRPGFTGNVEVWTLDGPALNSMVFFTGVPDGEPLFVPRGVNQKAVEKPPVFRSGMNPLEVQELVEATMARNFSTTIAEGHDLRPQAVDSERGFRFGTRFIGRDEIERHGVFVGTIRNGKLYGVWLLGAKLHYFDRYLPEYDRIIESAQLVGSAASGAPAK
jgi:hypothetical protein